MSLIYYEAQTWTRNTGTTRYEHSDRTIFKKIKIRVRQDMAIKNIFYKIF